MILYEIISGCDLGLGELKSGLIWCTDGSIMSPKSFRSSGRRKEEAHGYFINELTAVGLKCLGGHLWSKSINSKVVVNSVMDGFHNTYTYIFKLIGAGVSLSDYPVLYSCKYCNDVRMTGYDYKPYLPAILELRRLYESIYYVKRDLKEAGLLSYCDYGKVWPDTWSSSEECGSSVYFMCCDGTVKSSSKSSVKEVIPFFRIMRS